MQHRIPPDSSNPHRDAMAHAVETCVHCGFCLAACPTYKVLGEEMDSPRGRIVLMKQVLEGDLSLADVQPHIDRCLGCLGCVTACPSGVPYGELLTPFRSGPQTGARPLIDRLQRQVLLDTLESPALFRASARLGQLARGVERFLPARLRPMVALLPEQLPAAVTLPAFVAARGPRRARVALLAGCVQQALDPEISLATLRVLSANGVEVVVPPGQGCCGALALHSGEADRAYDRATALDADLPRRRRRHRHQRRGLRVGHEGVRPRVPRPGAGGCPSGILDPGTGCERVPARAGPRRGEAAPGAGHRGLPRRLPPRARAGHPVGAARVAVGGAQPARRRDPRRRHVLRIGRPLQRRAPGHRDGARADARPTPSSPPAPMSSRPATSGASCRSRRTSRVAAPRCRCATPCRFSIARTSGRDGRLREASLPTT